MSDLQVAVWCTHREHWNTPCQEGLLLDRAVIGAERGFWLMEAAHQRNVSRFTEASQTTCQPSK